MIFSVLLWNINMFFRCPLLVNTLGELPGITEDGATGKGVGVHKHAEFQVIKKMLSDRWIITCMNRTQKPYLLVAF